MNLKSFPEAVGATVSKMEIRNPPAAPWKSKGRDPLQSVL
jgi:hypothetical protein